MTHQLSIQSTQACSVHRAQRSLLARLVARFEMARSRRQLAELEPHRLQDIGLSARQACEEAQKGLWDAPNHWR